MFNPLKLIPTGVDTAKDKADFKLASAVLRVPVGLYIANSGLGKFKADEGTAQFLQNMAASGIPAVKEMDAKNFATFVAASETAVAGALLAPFVPNRLAGLGLTTFAAGLLSMYFRNPDMTLGDGIRPSQEGTPLSKDMWLAAIGAALMALPKK